jgi:putative transcriptional regulator
MTMIHHPSDATLLAFAGGGLDEGRSLVVATHLLACLACRGMVRVMEDVGGALLEELAPAPMAADALARTMARLDEGRSRYHEETGAKGAAERPGDLFRLLARYEHGQWRRIGPGLHRSSVRIPGNSDSRVFLLKGAPGLKLPKHTHTGVELTCVLTGGFSHAGGHFGPGAFDEADDHVLHQPVVDPGEECISLIAMQGELRLRGLLGRLLQPFVRI